MVPFGDRSRSCAFCHPNLFAYGPATPQKFAQWLGAPPLWAIEQFERCQRHLTKVIFDGTPAW
jgi:hypothetical protein